MPQPARKRAGAVLAPSPAMPEPSPEACEAARLAELAGAFALFGLAIAQPEPFEPSDFAYRTPQIPRPAPANDHAPNRRPAFPEIKHRGARIDPGLAIGLIGIVDWIVVSLAAEFAARWGAGAGLAALPLGQAAAFAVSAIALKAGLWITEADRVSPGRLRPEHGIGGLALGAILGVLIASVLAPDARGAAALAATLPIAAMLLAGLHAAFALWIGAAHRAGRFAENIVLVGANDAAARLAARAVRSGDARILAIVDDRLERAPSHVGAVPVPGALGDLLAWNGLPHIDRLIITVTQKAEPRVRAIIERLAVLPNRVDLLLDYETAGVRGRGVESFTGGGVALVSGRPRSPRRALLKRAQDLIVGGVLLALFAAPMLVIALAVKLDSKGPVLYRQARHGFNNRVFALLKFRTMAHAPKAQWRPARENDPRATRLGGFLRRSGLDELPMLFNVLRGEISLVGPHPHAITMKAANRALPQIVADYAHRHRVKPGLTGWAQVNGARGPLKTHAAVRERLRLDLDYAANASLWFDLRILLRAALLSLPGKRSAP